MRGRKGKGTVKHRHRHFPPRIKTPLSHVRMSLTSNHFSITPVCDSSSTLRFLLYDKVTMPRWLSLSFSRADETRLAHVLLNGKAPGDA